MIRLRPANERGHFDHGWLNTYHTFSFGHYQDLEHERFRSLRVMNEDFVAGGQGFGAHGHRDMEIVTYVLSGALAHKDSMGNGEVLRPGEFQRMTAGTGIRHSEFNNSPDEPVHLYQIWLLPDREGHEPSYEQKPFDPAGRHNQLQLVASPDGADGSLTIHQDARIYLADLDADRNLTLDLKPGRHAWLQVLRGTVELNGVRLETSDGAAVSDEAALQLHAVDAAEVMLFDLA